MCGFWHSPTFVNFDGKMFKVYVEKKSKTCWRFINCAWINWSFLFSSFKRKGCFEIHRLKQWVKVTDVTSLTTQMQHILCPSMELVARLCKIVSHLCVCLCLPCLKCLACYAALKNSHLQRKKEYSERICYVFISCDRNAYIHFRELYQWL